MGFEPDILIVDPASGRLLAAIEVKLHDRDHARADAQVRSYMHSARSPIAVIASPQSLWIYWDRYRTSEPESVLALGPFDLAGVPGRPAVEQRPDPLETAYRFEAAVQDWIERLGDEFYRKTLPDPLRDAVEEFLVPALVIGEVRAAGPRWIRRAASHR